MQIATLKKNVFNNYLFFIIYFFHSVHSEENHRNNVALLEKLVQISTRPFSKEYVTF